MKTKTSDLFISEVNKMWQQVKERDDTIFENITIQIDAETKLQEMKEKDPSFYMQLFHENSEYNKKKMIREYFWDNIIGELYENTINIMKEAGLLEEALQSFDKSYKIENTARLILENGVFARFSKNKKKEFTEEIIEMCFYPYAYKQNHSLMIEEADILEEEWVKPLISGGANLIRGAGRFTKNLYLMLIMGLVSPATFLVGKPAAVAGDKLMNWYEGGNRTPTGIDPSLRKFYALIDKLSPVNMLFRFFNQDLVEISKYLKKVNNLEDDDIKEILKELNVDPNRMIKKCWDKNKFQLSGDPQSAKIWDKFVHLLSGKGLANALRNPFYNNEMDIAVVLRNDAAKSNYQKMFYEFRVCVYEKLFEIIIGYAKTIYSMDDASYEIIKAANEAHKNKNFKAFFNLRPKQKNEEAMFLIMRTLVAIDAIATELQKNRAELTADKYIDKFIEFLRQNIKQVYQELDELANQRKYNLDRYQEENPSEEEKAEAIKQNRFNAKKSIFEED